MAKNAWSENEKKQLDEAVKHVTNENRWAHADKYHRKNVAVWRSIKICMNSSRPYHLIRERYQNYHDAEMVKNRNRNLTQLEERKLSKFIQRSPGGSVKFTKGFTAAATKLKIPVASAKKRFAIAWKYIN